MMAATEKRYPNLKYKYIRGLLDHEQQQRKKHWLKSAAEWTSKAIVSLELCLSPVKTVKQASNLDGIGKELSRKLGEVENSFLYSADPPRRGRFVTSAPALLVSLYIAKLQAQQLTEIKLTRVTVGESALRNLASSLCEESFLYLNDEDYESGDEVTTFTGQQREKVFCLAWWRLVVLIGRDYVKKRSVDKQPVYELLPAGEVLAKELKNAGIPDSIVDHLPEIPVHTVPNLKKVKTPGKRSQNEPSTDRSETPNKRTRAVRTKTVEFDNSNNHDGEDGSLFQEKHDEEALYIRDDGSDGLVLLFDTQESGGGQIGLGEIARLLDKTNVRYRSKKLEVGDYMWIWRHNGQQMEIPFVIERKRADDLARSLLDGRYESQKIKMLDWKQKFNSQNIDATLKYLIEGDPKKYVVKCGCGCGGVLKCGWPTAEQLEDEIEDLDKSEHFDVIGTKSIAETVKFLAVINDELQMRLDRGEFNELLQLKNQMDSAEENGHRSKKTLTTFLGQEDDILVIDDSPPPSDLNLDEYECEEDEFLNPVSKLKIYSPNLHSPSTRDKLPNLLQHSERTGSTLPRHTVDQAAPLAQYHSAKSSPRTPSNKNAISGQKPSEPKHLRIRGAAFNLEGLQPDLSDNGQKSSSQNKGTCSKQLFKKQDQKDPLSFWSGERQAEKLQNHWQPFAAKLHLSSSSRSVNSDNNEYLGTISSPKNTPSASTSSSIFTRKSVSGIIEEEEEVVIEGQSSCEVIDVDDFETAVDKGRTNTRMKQRHGNKSGLSTFGERVRNTSIRLPSLQDETIDISDSWTTEPLPKSFASMPNLKPSFKFKTQVEMKSWDSDSDESLPDLVAPEPSIGTSKLALGKARVESVNSASVSTPSDFGVRLKAVEKFGSSDNVTEDKINTIKAILPNTLISLIKNTLIQCRGDMQACMSTLLDS